AYTAVSKAEGTNDLKKPKTALSAREVPLTGYALDRLLALHIDDGREDGPMMLGYSRRRLSPSTARKRWNRFLDEHPDLPRVTLENMRHSFATSYLAAGGNVENLSRLLGHSDINTTLSRYVRPNAKTVREEMERVSSLLGFHS
ncbi:tyrosine-type recombinase/integrase, partial [Slackia exigua]